MDGCQVIGLPKLALHWKFYSFYITIFDKILKRPLFVVTEGQNTRSPLGSHWSVTNHGNRKNIKWTVSFIFT